MRLFSNIKTHFKFWWENKKVKVYIKFIKELREFVNSNADNSSLDKRVWSLYYFLGQHPDYDSLIISLNRFLAAKESYSRNEILLIRVLLFKLEFPLFWFNRVFFPVEKD